MKKASEYRANARTCRALASKATLGADRALLLKMAEQWEQLARDRADLVSRHPELDGEGPDADSAAPAARTRASRR